MLKKTSDTVNETSEVNGIKYIYIYIYLYLYQPRISLQYKVCLNFDLPNVLTIFYF